MNVPPIRLARLEDIPILAVHHRGMFEAMISDCKNRGIRRVLLNSSNEGRPIYEKIGFEPIPAMMRLMIEYKAGSEYDT